VSDRATRAAQVSRASLYSHLLTRQTGRAVRLGIERQVRVCTRPLVTILDFREVTIIDFSCADEVVARLARGILDDEEDHFLLVSGMEEYHLDPVQSALRRRDVVLPGERRNGAPLLLGEADPVARRAWEVVARQAGGVRPEPLGRRLGVEPPEALRLLEELYRRRLVFRRSDLFLSIRAAVDGALPGEEAAGGGRG